MDVTLADRQNCGDNPRRMSLRKIMHNFGAIISATFFRNRGNTFKGSNTPILIKIEKRTLENRSSVGQRIALRLRETRQRVKLLTTLLALKLRMQEWGFLRRSHHQTTFGPTESRNRRSDEKDRSFQCLPPLIWTGGVLQSILGGLIIRIPCSTLYSPSLPQTSKNKLTTMFSIACSTPGTVGSLFCTIRSQAAGIEPLLVSRSTTRNSGRSMPTKCPHQQFYLMQLIDQLTSKWCSM